jgi:hypothetical protein
MGLKYLLGIVLILPVLLFAKPQSVTSYNNTCHIYKITNHYCQLNHSSSKDVTFSKFAFNPFIGRKRKIILPASYHNYTDREIKTLLNQQTTFDTDVGLSPSAFRKAWEINKYNLNDGKGGQLVERNVVKVE